MPGRELRKARSLAPRGTMPRLRLTTMAEHSGAADASAYGEFGPIVALGGIEGEPVGRSSLKPADAL
jgi:hypothetical protein